MQGDTSGRGKAFVDIKIGSLDYQLGCWAAIGTGARCNELFNKTFSAYSAHRRLMVGVKSIDNCRR